MHSRQTTDVVLQALPKALVDMPRSTAAARNESLRMIAMIASRSNRLTRLIILPVAMPHCRRIAVSEQTHHRWCKKRGGLKTDQARQMKDLEKESQRLRRAISDLALD